MIGQLRSDLDHVEEAVVDAVIVLQSSFEKIVPLEDVDRVRRSDVLHGRAATSALMSAVRKTRQAMESLRSGGNAFPEGGPLSPATQKAIASGNVSAMSPDAIRKLLRETCVWGEELTRLRQRRRQFVFMKQLLMSRLFALENATKVIGEAVGVEHIEPDHPFAVLRHSLTRMTGTSDTVCSVLRRRQGAGESTHMLADGDTMSPDMLRGLWKASIRVVIFALRVRRMHRKAKSYFSLRKQEWYGLSGQMVTPAASSANLFANTGRMGSIGSNGSIGSRMGSQPDIGQVQPRRSLESPMITPVTSAPFEPAVPSPKGGPPRRVSSRGSQQEKLMELYARCVEQKMKHVRDGQPVPAQLATAVSDLARALGVNANIAAATLTSDGVHVDA